jgi:hypothetical protein
MQVGQVTEIVFFEISLNMVFNFVTLKFVIVLIFPIISGWFNLIWRHMFHYVLVPYHHEAVTIQVTARHFVLLRPVTLGWENDDINKIS